MNCFRWVQLRWWSKHSQKLCLCTLRKSHTLARACTYTGIRLHPHTCIHARTFTSTHAGTHACMHAGTRARKQTYMHAKIHTCTQTYIHARKHTYMHANIHTCTHTHACTHHATAGGVCRGYAQRLTHRLSEVRPTLRHAVCWHRGWTRVGECLLFHLCMLVRVCVSVSDCLFPLLCVAVLVCV
jgi:hypothetical protein